MGKITCSKCGREEETGGSDRKSVCIPCLANPTSPVKSKTVGLLYALLTKHIPYDELAQILRQNIGYIADGVYFNEHILKAAEDLYKRYIDQ
jgi:hypothetical protein